MVQQLDRIMHPDFGCFRQRSSYKRKLSVLFILLHAFLATIMIYGYFMGFIKRYDEAYQSALDLE